MMATKVKKVKKKAAKKSASSTTNGTNGTAATVGSASGNPNSQAKVSADQPNLPGVDTSRVPAIETAVKKIVEMQSQRKALKEEIDSQIDKLPVLFKKHDLRQYSCHGKTVVVTAGGVEVRIKKAKSQ